MKWFIKVVKEYATFKGRARRKEYWFYYLFYLLFFVVAFVVDFAVGTWDDAAQIGLFSTVYPLALLIPTIAVTVRRLHDTGRSGWWFLLVLVPIVGHLVLLVFMVLDSQPGDNAYGANPKDAPEA